MSKIRSEIQGLRMLAVAGVIADHLIGWPHGGFVGVDVFFVISGYLITGLLIREYEQRASISFVGFYLRRIKRILPAAMFVLLVTTAVSYVLLATSRFTSLVTDVVASSLFVANWRFGAAEVDYFQRSLPPSPVQHYWSLSIEEQFYFFWPWLMLGILLIGARKQWWTHRHVRVVAGTTIAAISLLSLVWAFHESATDPAFAYFSTFSRIWELGAGAILAILAPKLTRPWRGLSTVGVVGILTAYVLVRGDQGGGFPAPWALLPVLATVAVLASSAAGGSQPWILTNPVSRYLGDISYSLYLWHFPVVVLLLTLLPGGTVAYWSIGLVATLLLSTASYHFLEQPARKSDWLLRDRGHVVGLARGWRPAIAVCLAIVMVTAGAGYVLQRQSAPVNHDIPEIVAFNQTDANPRDCFGAAALDPQHRCGSLNPARSVAPAPGRVAGDTGGTYQCFSGQQKQPTMCGYGRTAGHPLRVAVAGDSHAAVLASAIRFQLDKTNWQLTTFYGYGCVVGHRNPDCPGHDKILDQLTSGAFDVVVVTWRRPAQPPLTEEEREIRLAAARHERAAFRAIVSSGTKLVAVEDVPSVTPQMINCVNRIGFRPSRTCQTDEPEAFESADSYAHVSRDVPGAALVRTRDLYCTHDVCPAMIGNVFVYLDTGSHITGTYLRSTSPYLVDRIIRAVDERNPRPTAQRALRAAH